MAGKSIWCPASEYGLIIGEKESSTKCDTVVVVVYTTTLSIADQPQLNHITIFTQPPYLFAACLVSSTVPVGCVCSLTPHPQKTRVRD